MSDLLTPAETAARLGVSVKTLANWRTGKNGNNQLGYIKRGRSVFYEAPAVEAWLESTAIRVPAA